MSSNDNGGASAPAEKREKRQHGTGSVCEFRDERGRKRFKVGITVNGKQIWKRLPPRTTPTCADDTARAWAKEAETDPDLQPEKTGESLSKWFGRWFDDRDSHGIQTKVDRGRIGKHVPHELAAKPAVAVNRGDLEGVVETLDRKVASSEMKWKNAVNIWGVLSKAFDDMAHGKTRALRIRSDNPAADVRGPDRGEKTLKQYLYPTEFSAFVACENVAFEWRLFVAVATYLYTRPGELEALQWEDIDLERCTVHVHRAIDYEHGGTKATKTDTPRRFAIELVLMPLLRAMHKASSGKGKLFPEPPYRTNGARDFRRLLLKAGVRRDELHSSDNTRQALTFRDTRATGITWRAVRGDDPLKIKASAGHKRFSTTEVYIREAEAIRDGFGDVFPSLAVLTNHSAITPPAQKEPNTSGAEGDRTLGNPDRRPVEAAGGGTEQQASPASTSLNPAMPGERSDCGVNDGPVDPVEAALAGALAEATRAGRWGVVGQLAKELEARRTARTAPNVVAIDRRRERR